METAEEQLLLEKIRKRDGAAMRRLFDGCAPVLMGLVSRYIPDKDDAQDVLQTSFISIFDNNSFLKLSLQTSSLNVMFPNA